MVERACPPVHRDLHRDLSHLLHLPGQRTSSLPISNIDLVALRTRQGNFPLASGTFAAHLDGCGLVWGGMVRVVVRHDPRGSGYFIYFSLAVVVQTRRGISPAGPRFFVLPIHDWNYDCHTI